jgi:hypothetical protein
MCLDGVPTSIIPGDPFHVFLYVWARCQIHVGRATIKEYAGACDFMQGRDEEALGLHLKEAITF